MINDSLLVIVLAQAVLYGTPLLYAALGELLAERSGVLNLGVEGMMLVGAVAGFWAVQRTPGDARSLLAGVVVAVWLYLSRTRPGLNVRAVGESPASADAMGINVTAYRYAHTLAGGAFAGVAGATFTLAITPQWVDGITGGAGWIAIALVIFAFWRPELCLVGAYFFGALQALAPQLQAREINLGPTVLWTSTLPYVMTIVVLVIVSASSARRRLGAPAALGAPYVREER